MSIVFLQCTSDYLGDYWNVDVMPEAQFYFEILIRITFYIMQVIVKFRNLEGFSVPHDSDPRDSSFESLSNENSLVTALYPWDTYTILFCD